MAWGFGQGHRALRGFLLVLPGRERAGEGVEGVAGQGPLVQLESMRAIRASPPEEMGRWDPAGQGVEKL